MNLDNKSQLGLLTFLNDSSEGVVSTCRVIVFSIETGDIIKAFCDIFDTHRIRIEKGSLNINYLTSVLCHLNFAAKPPPTSKRPPVSVLLS